MKMFVKPSLEIINIAEQDVIATSSGTNGNGNDCPTHCSPDCVSVCYSYCNTVS